MSKIDSIEFNNLSLNRLEEFLIKLKYFRSPLKYPKVHPTTAHSQMMRGKAITMITFDWSSLIGQVKSYDL